MPLTAHRQTPNRARELRERVWALVTEKLRGQIICPQCHCRLSNYDDKCTADLGSPCPGNRAIAAARVEAEREVGLT